MEFEIDNAIVDGGTYRTPTIQKAIEFLEKMPDGRIYTTRKLCYETGINPGGFRQYANDIALQPFRYKLGQKVLWGNRKTIEAYGEHVRNL
jgi:hypothetical protein